MQSLPRCLFCLWAIKIYRRAALQVSDFSRTSIYLKSLLKEVEKLLWVSFSLLVLKPHGQRGNRSLFLYLQNFTTNAYVGAAFFCLKLDIYCHPDRKLPLSLIAV
jgi:hypothetical protein